MITANAETELTRQFSEDFDLSHNTAKVSRSRVGKPSKKAVTSLRIRRSIEDILERQALDRQFEL
ncbi:MULTISPECIES: hypothetical protein [Vibrio]|uniref:Uncharacterized protein n=2 Tax=Vibrio TaxID=662 RepID=A0A5P9CRI8_9VIBR|nr:MULTISPECIES: hypothetical protein [Vibrio]MYM61594.1 hypothetical protein [Vibrio tetraodonis subsp. pristinus]QFT28824.1 hypothetical protein FIV01_20695 [Vibrio aquimaris]